MGYKLDPTGTVIILVQLKSTNSAHNSTGEIDVVTVMLFKTL